MAKTVLGNTNVCGGAGTKSDYPAGSKNPCPVCGHQTTTKKNGVLRNHAPKKSKDK